MSIRIREYDEGLAPALAEFNERLRAGGNDTRFPSANVRTWLPTTPENPVYYQYYLAVDDQGAVRGAYILKQQDFWLKGRSVSVGYIGLPVSEGIVNRAYAPVGVRLLVDAVRKQPLMYGLGMGGAQERLPQLLRAFGWSSFSVPFFFRILHPYRFFRNIVYPRRSTAARLFADAVALSGLGWAAVKGLHAAWYRGAPPANSLDCRLVDHFGDWADHLWAACRGHYGLCAVRDCRMLELLYPSDQPFLRLQVCESGKVIGWAVLLNTAFRDHRQFGQMTVGSVVDCLALPENAAKVIAAATRFLRGLGPDLIVSNQSHAAWCGAFRAAGYMRGPSNFLFAASKELTQLLRSANVEDSDLHFMRGDGDGPINL
jgi:hypothetical protein